MKRSTINKEEIDKFSKLSDEWWDPDGKFKPLHKFNPVRIEYIKKHIINHFKINKTQFPLKNLKILDIGCGGGLLSEPMSRLGANVTGIDASEKNIKIAKAHLKKSKLKIKYFCDSPENFKKKEEYDVILNMEIVEHVDDVELFIRKSSELLKKKGIMFIATLNKTLKSYIFAIVGAEYILRWLPIGTHEWGKFIKPDQLVEYGKKNSLELKNIDGMKFNPLINEWNISKDSSVNYIAEFRKF
tara:strand:+ start:6156 stop:6884 length:729 start_codon:yes stop_codon:yes gene_type:complete